MSVRRSVIVCLFVMYAGNLLAQSESATARAGDHLRAFMTARRVPGLSIAVGRHGKVIWAEGFGVSDLDTGAAVTTQSVFPIGSTTKALTSLALGILVEKRKIDLDAEIQTYVSYFPRKEHPITIRQLAGHQSGIRDYDMAKGEYANTRQFDSVKDAVAVFKDDPLLFEPGTKFAYSAYNFVLLSAAIEKASGRDFLSFVTESVTKPIGLMETRALRAEDPPSKLVTCYTAGFFGKPEKASTINLSNKWAAGGFVSTPTEMVRLGNAILDGKLVKPATFTTLTTPQKLKNGADTGAGYAMGWRSGLWKEPGSGRELRVVHHGGTANGAMSFFMLIPEEGLTISLQSNLLFQPFSEFSQHAYAVAAMFLSDAQKQPE
ncbi:MAG TPA: serine hydrolase domain-containing protein [Thermoanaerobaculia bacterium]|jgi:CubicO group peptidase (beta-lactamase class C family)|nr:serine hydrolase domain-containing protein [Thermoanaerobaculia bacterium]